MPQGTEYPALRFGYAGRFARMVCSAFSFPERGGDGTLPCSICQAEGKSMDNGVMM